jgi:hypothetical protein
MMPCRFNSGFTSNWKKSLIDYTLGCLSHLYAQSYKDFNTCSGRMNKLQLRGRNLGRVFNFRNGCVHVVYFLCVGIKLSNLKLKTWPKQLSGYLRLDIVFPAARFSIIS